MALILLTAVNNCLLLNFKQQSVPCWNCRSHPLSSFFILLLLFQSCCPSCPGCGARREASSARARRPRSSSSFRCSSSWSGNRRRQRVSSWKRPAMPAEAAAGPTPSSTATRPAPMPTPAPITTPTPVPTRGPPSPTHSTMHTAPSFYSAGGIPSLFARERYSHALDVLAVISKRFEKSPKSVGVH